MSEIVCFQRENWDEMNALTLKQSAVALPILADELEELYIEAPVQWEFITMDEGKVVAIQQWQSTDSPYPGESPVVLYYAKIPQNAIAMSQFKINHLLHAPAGIDINWRGAGWYTAQQEGAYENSKVSYYFVGADPENRPDGYGNLIWAETENDLM